MRDLLLIIFLDAILFQIWDQFIGVNDFEAQAFKKKFGLCINLILLWREKYKMKKF